MKETADRLLVRDAHQPRALRLELLQRLQRQLLGAHRRGDRPSDDPARVRVGHERGVRVGPVREFDIRDAGHVQPVLGLRREPTAHRIGPAARAPSPPTGPCISARP